MGRKQDAAVKPSSIRPMRKRVLIRVSDRDEMTGGIHIAPIAQGLPNTGHVVSVGAEVKECKPGDLVYFEKHAHADREYLLMEEGDKPGRYLLMRYDQIWGVETPKRKSGSR